MQWSKSAVLIVFALSACASPPQPDGAQARVMDAEGRLLGTLDLIPAGEVTRLRGRLQTVPPGTRALHVHERGLCEPPFSSAGGHFNPDGVPHGLETPAGGHAGDMPNVEVGADGSVNVDALVRAPLRGARGILDADGAAVVMHAGADDHRTDPAGNAGDRIACGVIQP